MADLGLIVQGPSSTRCGPSRSQKTAVRRLSSRFRHPFSNTGERLACYSTRPRRLQRPHGLTLDVFHGKSVHALPQLFGADGRDDPTVRLKLGLRNQRHAANDSARRRSWRRPSNPASRVPETSCADGLLDAQALHAIAHCCVSGVGAMTSRTNVVNRSNANAISP